MARFTDKVAITTGASTGLGPVMARILAEEGAKLVLAARRAELVEDVAAGIRRDIPGAETVAVRADVTEEEDVAAMVEAAMDRWGQVEVMMNNAAVPGTDKFIWEQTVDNFLGTYKVDCMAAMLCSREVLNRSMLARKSGAIVNFSSGAGWDGLPRKSHYSAAKGALRILAKVIAKEVGEQGVPVEEIRRQSAVRVPLKTISTPEGAWPTLPCFSPAMRLAPSPASRSASTPAIPCVDPTPRRT